MKVRVMEHFQIVYPFVESALHTEIVEVHVRGRVFHLWFVSHRVELGPLRFFEIVWSFLLFLFYKVIRRRLSLPDIMPIIQVDYLAQRLDPQLSFPAGTREIVCLPVYHGH